jgi:MFS family permease
MLKFHTAGSVLCAAAPTSASFITGRAIAGIGAAGLLQGAFGILTYVCTLEKRPLFLGGVVSLFGLFSSIGPVIGGVLTERASWRWCFWM